MHPKIKEEQEIKLKMLFYSSLQKELGRSCSKTGPSSVFALFAKPPMKIKNKKENIQQVM